MCVENCNWSSDGDCDDGGPGAEYSDCGYGADCFDCGVRQGQPPRAPPPPRPPRHPPSPPRLPGSVCVENCNWSSDGDCDDGGPGAEYADCGYGADCFDCGVRQGQPPRAPPPPRLPGSVCVEICNWSSDGDCDDGGPGAEYADCGYGADCFDCGVRQGQPPRAPPPPRLPGSVCVEICNWSSDGDCDDGGPGAEYSDCGYGADCFDCGVRQGQPPATPPGTACVENCNWSSDGDCDDGGPGAEYAACGYGADCIDCGVRQGQPPRAPPPPRAPGTVCVENCNWSSDGDCDDGGPGAEYADCGYGADCIDCGVRQGQPPRAPPPPRAPFTICTEICNWSSDGDCDDGGPGSEFQQADCPFGTDCTDCGPRQALPPLPSPPSPPSSPPSLVSSPPPLSGFAALMMSAKNSKPILAVVVACFVGLVVGACLCCRRARRSTPIVRAYDGTGQELPSLTTAPTSSAGSVPIHRGAPNERLGGMEAAIEAAFGRHVALKARYVRKRLFRAGRFKAFDDDEPTSASSGDSKI